MCWWAITGLTHLIIEASLLFTPNYLTKENPSFFDEICKFLLNIISSHRIHYLEMTILIFGVTNCMHATSSGKEYSKADSRYATGDTTTTAVEVIAVFLQGPLSLLVV